MHYFFEGLDKAAIHRALRQTIERTGLVTLISAVLAIIIMQVAFERVHPTGILISVALPLLLSTPTTLFMCLKHQQLRAANTKLEKLASIDSLTGILNRRVFSDQVNNSLDQSRGNKTPIEAALMLVDVDRFKQVNDTFGHDVGDKTLQLLVSKITSHLPQSAVFGRVGGEEFAVFLPQADIGTAAQLATDICRLISETDFSPAGLTIPLSISLGVAMATPQSDLRQLYRDADQKLYVAKNGGRNRVIFSHKSNSTTHHAA